MPAPLVATWTGEAKVSAHTAIRDLIDAGTNGILRIRNSADALLGSVTMTDPCGTVNGTSGQLTITFTGTGSYSLSGTVAYGELCKSDGTAVLSLPAASGTASSPGFIVLNTLTAVNGGPIGVLACVIG